MNPVNPNLPIQPSTLTDLVKEPKGKPATPPGQATISLSELESLKEDSGVVYEKGDDSKPATYSVDLDKVKAMKEETDLRMVDLFRSLVKKGTLSQVGGLRGFVETLQSRLAENKTEETPIDPSEFEITEEAINKAIEETSENGYWGAEQTSQRFLDFAKALSGDNPEKANLLLDAVKEGYKQAEEIWGGELPKLSQDTLALTIKKFEAWRDGDGVGDVDAD